MAPEFYYRKHIGWRGGGGGKGRACGLGFAAAVDSSFISASHHETCQQVYWLWRICTKCHSKDVVRFYPILWSQRVSLYKSIVMSSATVATVTHTQQCLSAIYLFIMLYIRSVNRAVLAQWLKYWPRDQKVIGSSPWGKALNPWLLKMLVSCNCKLPWIIASAKCWECK